MFASKFSIFETCPEVMVTYIVMIYPKKIIPFLGEQFSNLIKIGS